MLLNEEIYTFYQYIKCTDKKKIRVTLAPALLNIHNGFPKPLLCTEIPNSLIIWELISIPECVSHTPS